MYWLAASGIQPDEDVLIAIVPPPYMPDALAAGRSNDELTAYENAWRGSAIGIYRFWRDLGYGIGALGLGLTAHLYGSTEAAFWFVALSMFVSGFMLFWWGEETHPRLNPSPDP